MNQFKLVKPNELSVNHEAITSCVPGGLEYLLTFCFPGTSTPIALYKILDPVVAASKGYKEFMGLQIEKYEGKEYALFHTYTAKELEPHRFLDAVHCHACREVIYSVNPNHIRRCSCSSVYILGEGSSLEFGASDSLYGCDLVFVDLLAGRVILERSLDEH